MSWGTQGCQEQLGRQAGWALGTCQRLDLRVPGKEESFPSACEEGVCEAPAEGHVPGSGMESLEMATRVAYKSIGFGQGQLVTCLLGPRARQHLTLEAHGLSAAEPSPDHFTLSPSRDCSEQLLWA